MRLSSICLSDSAKKVFIALLFYTLDLFVLSQVISSPWKRIIEKYGEFSPYFTHILLFSKVDNLTVLPFRLLSEKRYAKPLSAELLGGTLAPLLALVLCAFTGTPFLNFLLPYSFFHSVYVVDLLILNILYEHEPKTQGVLFLYTARAAVLFFLIKLLPEIALSLAVFSSTLFFFRCLVSLRGLFIKQTRPTVAENYGYLLVSLAKALLTKLIIVSDAILMSHYVLKDKNYEKYVKQLIFIAKLRSVPVRYNKALLLFGGGQLGASFVVYLSAVVALMMVLMVQAKVFNFYAVLNLSGAVLFCISKTLIILAQQSSLFLLNQLLCFSTRLVLFYALKIVFPPLLALSLSWFLTYASLLFLSTVLYRRKMVVYIKFSAEQDKDQDTK